MNVVGGALSSIVGVSSQDLVRLEEDHMTLETFLLWVVAWRHRFTVASFCPTM